MDKIQNENTNQPYYSYMKIFPVFAKIDEIKNYDNKILNSLLKYNKSSLPNPHPEIKQNELFLGNFSYNGFIQIGWKSKRIRYIAYDINGNKIN